MRWLLFLSRLAFLCNVFFLLAVSLQFFSWLRNGDLQATILVLGFFMAAVLNPLANLCSLFLFLTSRNRVQAVPKWILFSNAAFLAVQIIYIIYRNGR
jgi:hypothetical protein